MRPISRRDLLVASAAALAASRSLGAQDPVAPQRPQPGSAAPDVAQSDIAQPDGNPAAPANGRRYQKALKIGMITVGATLAEKFTIARDCGFDGVEMDSPNGIALDEVLAAKEKAGIEIPGVVDSVHWHKPLSDPDAAVRIEGMRALETAIRDAAAYGASSVLLVPAVAKREVYYDDAWQRSQEMIRFVLPIAAEHKVQVLIENVWNNFLLGPHELARYVDEFENEWVGLHFDAGNLVKFGYPHHWVPILGQRIKKVDVKDYGRDGKGFDALLGEGDTDWPRVMAELDKIGYSGWYSAEVKGGDAEWLADVAGRMDALLAG